MHKTLLLIVMVSMFGCGDSSGDDDQGAPDASSGIDGAPAPTCAEYCTTIAANCTGEFEQYTDEQTCLDACAAYDLGTTGDMSGNTLACRTYHAGAASGAPGTHCVHAGPGGAGACGANCEGFCTLALSACTGANEQWASIADCMTECAGYDQTEPYDTSDTSGDTFACRMYHLTAAVETPDPHCTHIVEASPVCP